MLSKNSLELTYVLQHTGRRTVVCNSKKLSCNCLLPKVKDFPLTLQVEI